ncbi:MAG: UbiA prenyltransferase family protein [Candidatus Thermoplasmatota archaeon]|nr:UbiA prenyltransferase family protein [Candidatus Thermoplasmatota archaeon]
MSVREYLKLSRSFNAVLTGVSPVMGAIAMEQYNILTLFLLFLISFFGHTYGFVLNDIIDYNIDKTSKEISDRPLVSGTISIKKAWIYAIFSMMISFIIAFYLALTTSIYYPIIVLALSAVFVTIYDLISKKIPGMDIILTISIFFLILYGASTVVKDIFNVTKLALIVCILGSIQVLFMNAIAAGMKDIENDYRRGARTLAIKMGVRIIDGELKVPITFKSLAYGIQLVDILLVLLPFFIVWDVTKLSILQYLQWGIIIIIGIILFILSSKLLNMKYFDRKKARGYIGSHYMINFTIVPIMLMTLNPWAGLIMFLPGLGFILSNIILHGTITQPKTM